MENAAVKKENIIIDKKLTCCSIMKTMKISQYLDMVEDAYKNKGGIQGQREPLKQKTAITIRKRMIADIVAGTILPPVVIGVIVSEDEYEKAKKCSDIFKFLKAAKDKKVSIIDGMQRTTAILEATNISANVRDNDIRVELWISCDINSMLYRMLVLNTGQVPWNMRRQVELIFDGVISQIEKMVPDIDVLRLPDHQRRTHGGQYNAQDLAELFLAYGARTWKIDTREQVTDEFTRGDFIQSTGETNMVERFCEAMTILCKFDKKLDAKMKGDPNSQDKYNKGKDLFASQPARIGFIVACGEAIMGMPGEDKTAEQIDEGIEQIRTTFKNVFARLDDESTNVEEYMDFSTLSERMNVKSGKVGSFEREHFYDFFSKLIQTEGTKDSFTVYWRA